MGKLTISMAPEAAPGSAGSHGADPCESLGRDFQHGLGTSGMETWRDGEMAMSTSGSWPRKNWGI